jgi:hypothetical protein
VSAFLPPLILLAVALLAYCALTRFMVRRNKRIRADMPDATVDELAEAAVAEGHTGKLALGGFATLAVAATGAIWLLVPSAGTLL